VPFKIACPKEPAAQLQPLRKAVVSALTEWVAAFAVAAAVIWFTTALAWAIGNVLETMLFCGPPSIPACALATAATTVN
jgi:hypothetical protein